MIQNNKEQRLGKFYDAPEIQELEILNESVLCQSVPDADAGPFSIEEWEEDNGFMG